MTAPDLDAIAALIHQRCGLRFEGEGRPPLAAAVRRRMTAAAATSAAYVDRLAADEDEFGALVNLLTINETYFHREPAHLDLLIRRFRALLPGRTAANPIRVLCAGCSTGEEPYSLVIALKEAFGEAASAVSVLAVDIDSEALARAREGRYGELSFRSLPAALRERYFATDPAGSRVAADVRAAVRLARVNLMAEDHPALVSGPFDAILFRNVSIYFDTPTRRRIIARLAGLLADDGCLVVGASETLSNDFGLLRLIEDGGVFHFVKTRLPPPQPSPPPAARPPRVPTAVTPSPINRRPRPPAPPPPSPPPSPAEAASLIRQKRYDEAMALLAGCPPSPEVSRLRAQILFNRGQWEAAEQMARDVVCNEPWCADTLVLLGQVARRLGDGEAAIRWFKQAVYARPEAWFAHFCLAEAYRQFGSAALARREYGVVVQQLSTAAPGPGGAMLFPLAVAPDDVRRLCQRHLDLLAAQP